MSTIRELLGRKGGVVVMIGKDASVREAIEIMSDANIGAIVVQEDDQATGIFTERDYLRKIVLKGRSSKDTRVSEVMSSPLITVVPDDTVESAMETMTQCRCRHLPVMSGDELEGIVSLGDLVKFMLQEKEAEVEHLAHYISGSY
jgi:CBS domain-containing protein